MVIWMTLKLRTSEEVSAICDCDQVCRVLHCSAFNGYLVCSDVLLCCAGDVQRLHTVQQ